MLNFSYIQTTAELDLLFPNLTEAGAGAGARFVTFVKTPTKAYNQRTAKH